MFICAGGTGHYAQSDPLACNGSDAPGLYAHHQIKGRSPSAVGASVANFPPVPNGTGPESSQMYLPAVLPKEVGGSVTSTLAATVLRLLLLLLLLLHRLLLHRLLLHKLLLLLLPTLVPPASPSPPFPT